MEEEGIPACSGGHREVGYGVEGVKPEEGRVGDVYVVYVSGVYTPSHDSHILLETLRHVIALDRGSRSKSSVKLLLELGSGTGYITAGLVKEFEPGSAYAVMIDVDPRATYASWLTSRVNEVDAFVDVVQCDGSTCIRSRSVDLVYFNPPYLPVCDDLPEAISWSGGEDGLRVWLKFFFGATRVCKSGCKIVYVMSTLQDLAKMFKYLSSCSSIEIFECQSFFYETICGVVVECP